MRFSHTQKESKKMYFLAQIDAIPVPPDLEAIWFPLTFSSIALAVGTAGATMIGLWATYKIGFKLVRKLTNRTGSTI